MSNFKSIRDLLGVTQAALASGMGCTQGNVSFYEKGQTVPPDAAKRLIEFAASLGHTITFNDIYGEGVAFDGTPTGVAQVPKVDTPLTTDPALAADMAHLEREGIVKLPKPAKPVEAWDGKERRKFVRREEDAAKNAELATLRAAGQGG